MCHDCSWPGFCSLMVSICEAVNVGVCEGVTLHHSDHILGACNADSLLMGR